MEFTAARQKTHYGRKFSRRRRIGQKSHLSPWSPWRKRPLPLRVVSDQLLHPDHLGTPQKLTNDSQQVVWEANYTPFLQATINDDVDGDGNAVTFDMRAPGQWFDQETGLSYNYFRYYDPNTGRYITSDPIGLNAGLNTYAYVGNNPLYYTDPLGLVEWQGKYWYAGAGETLGGGKFIFNLVSECVDGKQQQVTVSSVATGIDIGFPITNYGTHLTFQDSNTTPNPNAFNGNFTYVGLGISPGIGASLSAISFNNGSVMFSGWAATAGLDIGFTELSGKAKVENSKALDCSCGNIKKIY